MMTKEGVVRVGVTRCCKCGELCTGVGEDGQAYCSCHAKMAHVNNTHDKSAAASEHKRTRDKTVDFKSFDDSLV